MSIVENLEIKREDYTLKVPRWEIRDEGIHVLSGPSGSGKTTILRALMGLEKCQRMSWKFLGEDLANLPVEQRRVGLRKCRICGPGAANGRINYEKSLGVDLRDFENGELSRYEGGCFVGWRKTTYGTSTRFDREATHSSIGRTLYGFR